MVDYGERFNSSLRRALPRRALHRSCLILNLGEFLNFMDSPHREFHGKIGPRFLCLLRRALPRRALHRSFLFPWRLFSHLGIYSWPPKRGLTLYVKLSFSQRRALPRRALQNQSPPSPLILPRNFLSGSSQPCFNHLTIFQAMITQPHSTCLFPARQRDAFGDVEDSSHWGVAPERGIAEGPLQDRCRKDCALLGRKLLSVRRNHHPRFECSKFQTLQAPKVLQTSQSNLAKITGVKSAKTSSCHIHKL